MIFFLIYNIFTGVNIDKTTKNVQNTMQVSINKSKNLLTQPLIDSDGANCSINTNTADDIVNVWMKYTYF